MRGVAMSHSAQRVQLASSRPVGSQLRSRASARAASRPQRARRFAAVASADAESPALPAAVAIVAPVVRARLPRSHTFRHTSARKALALPRCLRRATPGTHNSARRQAAVAASAAAISSGAISTDAISDYLHATAGFVFDASSSLPDWLVKYFHGINMATVLFAMGGYGTYLGYQIRAGNGGDPTFGTPDTAADLHPKLMAGEKWR